MSYPSILRLISWCLALLVTASPIRAEKLVLATSQATRDYLQKRMAEGKRQPQSYVFMPGRYMAGNTNDRSLDKTSFRTIAERLAQDLRGQDFFPAPSLSQADLLLVVHWGATVGRNRDSVALATSAEALAGMSVDTEVAQNNFDEAVARGDMETAANARDTLINLSNETRSEYQNMAAQDNPLGGEDSAALLGLSSALRKDDKTLFEYEQRKTLFEMTRDECYFVIVMAYDARTLVSSKKLKRVWTMRVSMSSAGVNFHQALDRLSNVARQYFGTKHTQVAFAYPADRKRTERVDIGELVVIGPATP